MTHARALKYGLNSDGALFLYERGGRYYVQWGPLHGRPDPWAEWFDRASADACFEEAVQKRGLKVTIVREGEDT